MRLITLLTAGVILCGCATVKVQRLQKADFEKDRIPNRIVVVAANDTPQTTAKVRELSGNFAAAGFTVLTQEYVNGMLSVYDFNLKDLVNAQNFTALRDIGRIEGVVLVREFYGTELHFIDIALAREIASGCWRSDAITTVNEVIGQIRDKTISPGVCPLRIE